MIPVRYSKSHTNFPPFSIHLNRLLQTGKIKVVCSSLFLHAFRKSTLLKSHIYPFKIYSQKQICTDSHEKS